MMNDERLCGIFPMTLSYFSYSSAPPKCPLKENLISWLRRERSHHSGSIGTFSTHARAVLLGHSGAALRTRFQLASTVRGSRAWLGASGGRKDAAPTWCF